MRKSKMKRLKKLEYAFNHGCNIQVLEPVYCCNDDECENLSHWELMEEPVYYFQEGELK